MSFNADLFENIHASADNDASQKNDEPSGTTNVSQTTTTSTDLNSARIDAPKPEIRKTTGRPGRPRTGKMERIMCYFPKELVEDMNHFSEKEMISRNAFIITCILKHIRELKKEEREEE